MGRGIVEASPLTVWEAVKNPLSRYIYDNMLKVLSLSVFTSWWDLILRLPCRRQNSRREKLGYEQLAERNAIVGVWVKYVIERPRSSGPRAGRFVRSHCALEKSMFRNATGFIANAQFDRRET